MEEQIYFILINNSSAEHPNSEPSIKMSDFLKVSQEVCDIVKAQEAAK